MVAGTASPTPTRIPSALPRGPSTTGEPAALAAAGR